MMRAVITRRGFTLGGAALAASATAVGNPAFAAGLEEPADRPILTVGGKIKRTNDGDKARFDRAMLEKLGMVSFETTTPWYNGLVKFEGVPMAKLMEFVGAEGTIATAVALNDYITEIPITDFAQYGVILALKRDGNYMPVRDKGPLFIVYPYDSNPELKHQKYYGRSAWQVAQLIVK